MRTDDRHPPITTDPEKFPDGSATSALLATLRPRFRGRLLTPHDPGYSEARLGWNRAIDSRPALVAVAAGTDDVQAAVRAARVHGVPLAVQSTGHGAVRSADGALLLRTSALNGVDIDPERRLATVGPGAVWSDVTEAAARFGLGSLAGRCSSVGVTGYTLGGGTGWLSRRFGYAADNVVRAELVTADGTLVVAAPDEHPDLFWALRGGGGNFGVVTRLQFRLHPTPTIFAGMSFHALDGALDLFSAYQDWAPTEPDEMNSAVLLMRLPAAPAIPEPLRDRRVLALRSFHLGDEQSGRRILAPLLEAAGPALFDSHSVRTFPAASAAANGPDVPPVALRQYVEFFHHLPGAAVADAVGSGSDPGSPMAFVELRHWGGAISRPGPDAGPAGARDVPFSVMAVAPYGESGRTHVDAHVDRLDAQLGRHATGEAFLNLLTDPARTRDAFTPSHWSRLRQVKSTWDPTNLFRTHHMIPPLGGGPTTPPITRNPIADRSTT